MSVGHCVVIEDAQNVIAYFVVPVNVCVCALYHNCTEAQREHVMVRC